MPVDIAFTLQQKEWEFYSGLKQDAQAFIMRNEKSL